MNHNRKRLNLLEGGVAAALGAAATSINATTVWLVERQAGFLSLSKTDGAGNPWHRAQVIRPAAISIINVHNLC
jgi:hypothetical protein